MNNDYFNDLVDEYESIFGKLTVSEATKGLFKMFHDQMFISEQMESIADDCKDENTAMLLRTFAKTNRPTSEQFAGVSKRHILFSIYMIISLIRPLYFMQLYFQSIGKLQFYCGQISHK